MERLTTIAALIEPGVTPAPFTPEMLPTWWRAFEQSIAHLVEWNRKQQSRRILEWGASGMGITDWINSAPSYGTRYGRWCAIRNLERFTETRGRSFWTWFFGPEHFSPKMPVRPPAEPAPYVDPLAMMRLLDHLRVNELPIYYYMTAVAYCSLLRPCELMNLRTKDLFIYNTTNPYIFVEKGKGPRGGKSREAPITKECAGVLQVYLQARASIVHLYLHPGTVDEGWLWVKPSGKRLDDDSSQWTEVMRRAYAAVGVRIPKMPRGHMRKTGAQHSHMETEDKPSEPLVHLSDRLGHVSMDTTAGYARVPAGHQQVTVDKYAFPLNGPVPAQHPPG